MDECKKKYDFVENDPENYTSVFKDNFKTPEELIFSTLNDLEIKKIMDDPAFFKAQKSLFKGVVAFDNVSLKERIEMEDNFKTKQDELKLYKQKAKRSLLRSCKDVVMNLEQDYNKLKKNKQRYETKDAGLEAFIDDEMVKYKIFKRDKKLIGEDPRRRAYMEEETRGDYIKISNQKKRQPIRLNYPPVKVEVKESYQFSERHERRRVRSIEVINRKLDYL